MSGKYRTRTIKPLLFTVLVIQLLATVERQVFDFLGYMWAPIIGNFFQIIAVILALFGACQHYRSFVVVYAVWSLLWMGWNLFVICLYLEVGILNRRGGRYILTLGTDTQSWWVEHGIGCSSSATGIIVSSGINNNTGLSGHQPETGPDPGDKGEPQEQRVEGCILQYYYVEVIHASVQVLLAVAGLGVSLAVIQASLERGTTCKYLARTRTYAPPPLCHPLLSSSSSSPLPSLLSSSYSTSRGQHSSHYPPPSSSSSSSPSTITARLVEKRGWRRKGGGGYLSMPTTSTSSTTPSSHRDSWCLPTYVSFHRQSMDELSGSFTCASSINPLHPYPSPNPVCQSEGPVLCVPPSTSPEVCVVDPDEGGLDHHGGSCSNVSSPRGLEVESCGSLGRSSSASSVATATTTATSSATSDATTTTTMTTTTTVTTGASCAGVVEAEPGYMRVSTPVESSPSSSSSSSPLMSSPPLDRRPPVEQV